MIFSSIGMIGSNKKTPRVRLDIGEGVVQVGNCGGRGNLRLEGTTTAKALCWEHAGNTQGPARKPLGWNGGRGKVSGYYVRDICTLEVGVGQIMQDSLGMMRNLVFTLNLMEPLWGFEPG